MSDYRVRLTGRARQHLKTADSWWRKNRPTTEERVVEEFARASSLLAQSPNIGKHYAVIEEYAIRRHSLRTTPYYLYYCVRESTDELWIVAVWSATRKRGPLLKLPPRNDRG